MLTPKLRLLFATIAGILLILLALVSCNDTDYISNEYRRARQTDLPFMCVGYASYGPLCYIRDDHNMLCYAVYGNNNHFVNVPCETIRWH